MPEIDFFICYTKADEAWAEWIAWQLEDAGYAVRIQAWDFRPGNNWVLEMQSAASLAQRTIAVLSPAFVNAVFTQPEWAAAFARDPTGINRILIPVRVQECDARGLILQIVHVDLCNLNEESARQTLLDGVKEGRLKPADQPVFPGHSGHEEPAPQFPGAANANTRIDQRWWERPRRPVFGVEYRACSASSDSVSPEVRIVHHGGETIAGVEWRYISSTYEGTWSWRDLAILPRAVITARIDLNSEKLTDAVIPDGQVGLEIRFEWQGFECHQLHPWQVMKSGDGINWALGEQLRPRHWAA